MTPYLGRVKGPGERPHTFQFVAPDADQVLKNGEFITYETTVDGQPRSILARVTERRPLRLYPDGFLGDPRVDPKSVAQVMGYEAQNKELFEITGEIIGYFDDTLRDFINPRVSPGLGTPIARASDSDLSRLLSRVPQGAPGAATVGWLATRQREQVEISIDVAAIASTHLAIIASTGAGKSYTASVLIEEMLKPNNRAAILIIDPHSEYDTLAQIATRPELWADGYRPETIIHKPGGLKIRVGALAVGDLRYLLPNLSDRMEYVLTRALRSVENARSRAIWIYGSMDVARLDRFGKTYRAGR